MKNRPPTAASRLSAIRDIISQNQGVSISQLAKQYDVSEITIRRDLTKLEEQGEVQRTHGGAMPTEKMQFEFDFSFRRSENQNAKREIASEAAKLIEPGHRIILDNGTTTLELAMLLRDRQDITVITPSLAVAAALQFSEGIETILLGGTLRRGRPELTGVVTETVLNMFSVNIAFQGSDGIGLDGSLHIADSRIAQVDRQIRTRAARTYILADSSKIGKTALISHGYLRDVEALIIDSSLSKKHLDILIKTGANIFIAK